VADMFQRSDGWVMVMDGCTDAAPHRLSGGDSGKGEWRGQRRSGCPELEVVIRSEVLHHREFGGPHKCGE